jgi:hypothetical protein
MSEPHSVDKHGVDECNADKHSADGSYSICRVTA